MDLPRQFDVLVLGTGLTESIIAAASSRVGKSVLHLDRNSFYGSQWTSLNFRQVDDWIRCESENDRSLFSNIESMESFSDPWNREELNRLGSKINIDLCPRVNNFMYRDLITQLFYRISSYIRQDLWLNCWSSQI